MRRTLDSVLAKRKAKSARRKLKRGRYGEFKGGKEWHEQALLAQRKHCEIPKCGIPYVVEVNGIKCQNAVQHIHHIFSRRFLDKWVPDMSPHAGVNLLSCCGECHGYWTSKIENFLFRGDTLRFVEWVKKSDWPIDRIKAAAQFYGLKELVKFL